MDKTPDLEQGELSSEKIWFQVLGILSLFWLAAYVLHWFTWDYFLSAISSLAALGGLAGGLCWGIGGIILRSKRMLVIGAVVFAFSAITISGRQMELKAHAHLWLNEGRYLEIVNRELKSPVPTDGGRADGVAVDTAGGGVRVAFDLGGGFMGDFPTIIHDKEGSLRIPSYGEYSEERPFNGQYHSVTHLRGPWYFAYLYPD